MDALAELFEREAIRSPDRQWPSATRDRDAWEALWTDDLVFVVDGAAIEGLPAVKDFSGGRA